MFSTGLMSISFSVLITAERGVSGTALPAPVVLRRIDTDTDAALRREAVSFGAVSHLIVSPGLHEADQSYLAKVFDGVAPRDLGLV